MSYARGDWTSGSRASPSTTGYTPSGTTPSQPTPAFPLIYWDGTACSNHTNAGVNCGFNGSINCLIRPPWGEGTSWPNTERAITPPPPSDTGARCFDKYKGDRTPQYINWTFGIQRQITRTSH